jgi:hypothetical protein
VFKQIILGCVAIIMIVLTTYIVNWLVPADVITILTGAAVGVLVAAPCTALCTYIIMTQNRRRSDPAYMSETERWYVERARGHNTGTQMMARPDDADWRYYR